MIDSLRFEWNSAKKKYPSLLRNLKGPDGVEPGSEMDLAGRALPNMTLWKICNDVAAGLSHIHAHGVVHQDIKPSNIFFTVNVRFGAMCKIGDFGMSGDIGTSGDGQEGDTKY
jgi:serine/threonine protein kinase